MANELEVKNGLNVDGTTTTTDLSVTNGIATETSSSDVNNLAIDNSVAASAMTLTVQQRNGSSDPSVSAPARVAFRNATVTDGSYSFVNFTSADTIVIPSGATLGHEDGVEAPIHVYAINNSGTAELAVSRRYFPDDSIVSTTTIGAGSDDAETMYSTTGRSNVPCKLIQVLRSSQTTAGTYAATATESTPKPSTVKMTDWISFTPTGSLSTNVAYLGFHKTVGDTLHVRYYASFSGTNTEGAWTLEIPSGFVIDDTKLPGVLADTPIGQGELVDSGTAVYLLKARIVDTNTIQLRYFTDNTTAIAASTVKTNTNSPFTIANNDEMYLEINVPIEGASSIS